MITQYSGDLTRARIMDYLKFRSRNEMLPPSVREIGEAVGLSSSSTVYNHLRQLERQGKIHHVRHISRSVRIVRDASEICPCCDGTGWKARPFPGTELIGDNRPPSETSFGH